MFGLTLKKKVAIAVVDEPAIRPGEARAREAEATAATLSRIVRVSDEAAAAIAALDAVTFRDLASAHADARRAALRAEEEARRAARRARVEQLAAERLSEDDWRTKLERALEAAARGEKEFLLIRFPSELCEDGGRMINAPDPDWPKTLRGPAADIHARWRDELKPRGFGLAARILEFPGGFPGDAGLSLTWGA
ncbi:MAG: hypothetical protein OEL76_15865 [Siculibacillus sp.]|nr:hypothetical protein [Siculibacillus sp.]